MESADGSSGQAEIPSCLSCRRRKMKCSRELPECSHCKRLELTCEYDLQKSKPGVKAGVVGSLTRRVEALEQAAQQHSHADGCCQHQHAQGNGASQPSYNSPNVVEVLSMLTAELQKLNSKPQAHSPGRSVDRFHDNNLSPAATSTSSRYTSERASYHGGRPQKRRRLDSCGNLNVELELTLDEQLAHSATSLPQAHLLERVIDLYFDIIQPWIPILHETQFRRRIHENQGFARILVILHAMVIAALRFVDDPQGQLTAHEIEQQAARSRRFILLTALDDLSVESLQALIIVASTDIGNGDASKAWSVIGSLTRTVEYLQLSVESDDHSLEPPLKPQPTLSDHKDWTQEEERRRVFWNVFCLDRFCSVTTGWKTSLTSDDVKRRLPADGGLWHKGEFVTTPYFGIWDKSVAKIGHSIAFLPGSYPRPGQAQETPAATSSSRAGAKGRHNHLETTTIGAFAYRIEATESLSQITTYFLQQNIDYQDKGQVSDWLTRFKELDLRLVHWKMFLPQRWKDSNVSRQPDLVTMDPNLTLAHITHNASMILLHQRIAYPDVRWASSLRLPSLSSAEVCQTAAVETCSITQKYLEHTAESNPMATQFAFCVFISARVLLVHWKEYGTDLAPEFWILIHSLDEVAKRWTGRSLRHRAHQTQAGKYAEQLRQLQSRLDADPYLKIDVLGYTSGTVQGSLFNPTAERPTNMALGNSSRRSVHDIQQDSQMSPQFAPEARGLSTPRPPHGEDIGLAHGPSGHMENLDGRQDNLSIVPQMFMDEDFMVMDRIISLDDEIFAIPGNGAYLGANF